MDAFSQLLNGFAVALTPINLLWCLVGTTLGTAIGVLPGLGPALTIALLLPITFKVEPTAAFILFAGIYYGAMYGGSTTSILLNTPGESASIITALEGNKMARAGRGGPALATAAIGSFVAGLIATAALAFIAPEVAKVAISFGEPEKFALILLAFITVSAAFGDSPMRGLTSLAIGLTIGLIGLDELSGRARLTFGSPELLGGIGVTILAVALFAIGEALSVAEARGPAAQELRPRASADRCSIGRHARFGILLFWLRALSASRRTPRLQRHGLPKRTRAGRHPRHNPLDPSPPQLSRPSKL